MITNPFETAPDDVESVVATVKREAVEECEAGEGPIYWALDDCTWDAVATL